MKRLTITVSDPWDFVTPSGSNVFTAELQKADDQGPLLLRLVEPVRWAGSDWHWFVATSTPTATWSLYGITESRAADDWLSVPQCWRGESPVARVEIGE